MSFKQRVFKASNLIKVSDPPPPDDPPLQIGDWCTLNSGSPPWLVVDTTKDDVIVALNDQEHDFPRACVRRTTAAQSRCINCQAMMPASAGTRCSDCGGLG